MYLSEKQIRIFGMSMFGIFLATGAGIYFEKELRSMVVTQPAKVVAAYSCPMHSNIVSAKPAFCSECGMALVSKTKSSGSQAVASTTKEKGGCCGDKKGPAAGGSACKHEEGNVDSKGACPHQANAPK